MSMLGYKSLFFTLRTVSCRACDCPLSLLQHSVRSHSLVPSSAINGAPFSQSPKKYNKYSTYCGKTQRNLSAVASSHFASKQQRPLSRFDFLDLGDIEELTKKGKQKRKFIINPDLANVVTECLDDDLSEDRAILFECNPGPGVLTRSLLNAGARRVIALESEKHFLPHLQSLENQLDGQLKVVHCDFFKLDPIGHGSMTPPAMFSEKLFSDLGISEVPWTADIPVKVVGIFSQKNERNMLWKLIYSLFERISLFQYGRVELDMFISEKEYTKLIAQPGNLRHYQALSALWQMACDIQLLHMEPWSSFVTNSKNGSGGPRKGTLTNDHLCLVRMTPRKDLFNETLTTANSATLVLMMKQCLTKRKAKLIDQLNSWSPGCGEKLLLQLDIPKNIFTGHVYPDVYKQLFQAMEHSQDFRQSWLYKEILENINSTLPHFEL
ncbi:dimethyladenosine transferase 2, mitochondrial isoform X2 [Callorhinchus milii]|uniref:rRNA adenine N(6)-methyltransferase n=2 Tax=Callorhinchus milii TaxID=7868 RepID=V9KMF1_CALMI|nr:dimethyladenosine transferase 2, mitochondrial isoform X2 [Callorhinchus milii]|eukprot:gi/632961143/ref/XP_007896594.1/ PREDICTED: dimethyladenosine transferase 2, mitochondrial isoform X2 [Callorhinchus milii]